MTKHKMTGSHLTRTMSCGWSQSFFVILDVGMNPIYFIQTMVPVNKNQLEKEQQQPTGI